MISLSQIISRPLNDNYFSLGSQARILISEYLTNSANSLFQNKAHELEFHWNTLLDQTIEYFFSFLAKGCENKREQMNQVQSMVSSGKEERRFWEKNYFPGC